MRGPFDDKVRRAMMIQEKIRAYHGSMTGEHHRYRSWEHCYGYFRQIAPQGVGADRDHAALQLGFYLASWGMYRGSSFLLQHAYTVHRGVIELLLSPRFSILWDEEFGAGHEHTKLVPVILEVINAIKGAYRPFAPTNNAWQPSDTLVTKVLLGTFGCLPACDRYFISGFRSAGFKYSYLNARFVERILHFCRDNLPDLLEEQTRIELSGGMHYPLMKLVDMYFWQTGYERETSNPDA